MNVAILKPYCQSSEVLTDSRLRCFAGRRNDRNFLKVGQPINCDRAFLVVDGQRGLLREIPPPLGGSVRRQLQRQRSPGCHIPGEDFASILSEIVKCASRGNDLGVPTPMPGCHSPELVGHQTALIGCMSKVTPLEATQVFPPSARRM